MRQRYRVWLEIELSLSTQADDDDVYDDIRRQGEQVLDRIEKAIREMEIGEPLYLQVGGIEWEGSAGE